VRDHKVLDGGEARPAEILRRAIKVGGKSDQESEVLPWATKKAGRVQRPGTYLFWGPIVFV
jgi:hypothetical protein